MSMNVCNRSGPFYDCCWFGLANSSHLTDEFYLFPLFCLFPFTIFLLI